MVNLTTTQCQNHQTEYVASASEHLIEWTDEMLDQIIEVGYMLCGNPEVSEQLEAYQSVGCDQVVFGF